MEAAVLDLRPRQSRGLVLKDAQRLQVDAVALPGARVLVGALVDPSLKRALEDLAEANDRSLSAELRTAIRHHLGQPT